MDWSALTIPNHSPLLPPKICNSHLFTLAHTTLSYHFINIPINYTKQACQCEIGVFSSQFCNGSKSAARILRKANY